MKHRRRPDRAVRLVACDLDGTLLREDGTAAAGVAGAVARLAGHGVPLVVVTGRPHGAAGRLCAAAGLHPAVIASFHGGLVVDMRDGTVLRRLALRARRLAPLVDVLVRSGLEVSTYQGLEPAPEPLAPGAGLPEAVVRIIAVGSVDDVAAAFDRSRELTGGSPAGAATRPGLPARGCLLDRGRAKASVGDLVRVERPSPTVLDVRHRSATKDRGLRAAARALGLPMRAVLAAGDGPSDAGMLTAAGWGVAVGSSSALPASVADAVVSQDGLADYLLSLVESARPR